MGAGRASRVPKIGAALSVNSRAPELLQQTKGRKTKGIVFAIFYRLSADRVDSTLCFEQFFFGAPVLYFRRGAVSLGRPLDEDFRLGSGARAVGWWWNVFARPSGLEATMAHYFLSLCVYLYVPDHY